ncbi:AraC family transcriptional regulator [Actinoplanes sp. NPDC049265]|uniref:AraC family transcriptional regulator n=1 Tax=Actinoplanes sp. NPDC049265 TaxID=3363902 RepID=UPI00371A6BAA
MISAALGSVRLDPAKGRRIRQSGAWGVRLPPIAALGFHVLLAGEGWLITAADEPVRVRPGDVVFTAAGTEHGLARTPCRLAELPPIELGDRPVADEPCDFEFLCGSYSMRPGQTPAFLRRLPGVVALTPRDDPTLTALVEMLRADLTSPGAGTEAGRSALVDLMIVHILRQMRDEWPLAADPRIADALHEIHGRPERPWTVTQLSGVARMSRTSFARRFTNEVGVPPMTYLTDWRLSSGARLLRQTSDPLASIARRVGYSTEFAFAAAFRRRYGLPPGRFRSAGAMAAG